METAVSYSFRKSVAEPCRTFTLSAEGVLITAKGRPQFVIPYGDVRQVRLLYRPLRYRTENYVCELALRSGRTYVIYSTTFESFGVFKDLRETYVPFVRELVRQLSETGAEIFCGNTPSRFYGCVALMVFALPVLIVLFAVVPLDGASGAVVKLLLVICWLYYGIATCRANYPKPIHDAVVPDRVLPV